MSLNKNKGNMYSFFNNYPYKNANRGCTWNPIRGLCPFHCSYCFMEKMYKRYKWNKKFELNEKFLRDNLGKDRYIFVGSSTDMWSEEVKGDWIEQVLKYCKTYPNNQYFFQSKNPERFIYYSDRGKFPDGSILTTTIETNRQDLIEKYSEAPSIASRIKGMENIEMKKMLTIEPIMMFSILEMIDIVKKVNPLQVNIGADSGHNNLLEPSSEKIGELIKKLRIFTKVNLKDNLKRLYHAEK